MALFSLSRAAHVYDKGNQSCTRQVVWARDTRARLERQAKAWTHGTVGRKARRDTDRSCGTKGTQLRLISGLIHDFADLGIGSHGCPLVGERVTIRIFHTAPAQATTWVRTASCRLGACGRTTPVLLAGCVGWVSPHAPRRTAC